MMNFLDNWFLSYHPSTLNLHCLPIDGKIQASWIHGPSQLALAYQSSFISHFGLILLYTHSSHLKLNFDLLPPPTHDKFCQSCLLLPRLLSLPGHTAASSSSSPPPLLHLTKSTKLIFQWSAGMSSIPSHLGINEVAVSLSSHGTCS